MKKLSKLMCLLLAVGMLMGIASCSSDAGEGGGGSSGGTETVRISCGPLNGYQNVLYNSIADMMNKANPGKYSFAIEASTGSAENARLLAMDETDFGTMGMDMTLSCYNAGGEFEGLPAEQIMHVATHSGTGATVHVITSAKSDINSIPDLAGTKFGVTAGMMAGYLDDVLWAYDMTTDDLGSVVNLSLSDLCTALQDGNIDAFLYATPAPGTNFTDLAMSFGIKVVDIELHPKSWTRKSTKGVQKSMGKELFSEELKLAVVQYVLEGHTRKEASEKFCVSCTPIEKWVNLYKLHGAKGLLSRNLVGRQKGFDGEFRLKVLQYKQEHHLSCTQTAMHFCLDVVTVCRWEKKFQKEGAQGLMKKQATKGSEKRQKKQEQSELQQENKRLSEENYRLKMENDYLKKLNALIQKREKPE